MFCIVVFYCDGLLARVPAERCKLPELARWSRFLDIAIKLPMELQMVLCNRLGGFVADLIPLSSTEEGFKFVAQTFCPRHEAFPANSN